MEDGGKGYIFQPFYPSSVLISCWGYIWSEIKGDTHSQLRRSLSSSRPCATIHPSLTQILKPIAHRPTGSTYFAWEEDKNTCTDDTPLGRRKQKVPQTTDETGNIAAILSNRPTVRQILTSAGLILIALCTVRASWIKYWLEVGWIEQNTWIL